MADIDEQPLGTAVLAGLCQQFQSYKTLADRALAQLQAEGWRYVPAPGANSIAVVVQHLVGNLRSRFTDFLTSDGEKPDRQRDLEFIEPTAAADISQLQMAWDTAWPILFQLFDSLQSSDLLRTVTIRGEAHTVLAALQRQATHYSYHVGQIVQLAKLIRGEDFQSLSIPRGQSEQFNQSMSTAQ